MQLTYITPERLFLRALKNWEERQNVVLRAHARTHFGDYRCDICETTITSSYFDHVISFHTPDDPADVMNHLTSPSSIQTAHGFSKLY